MGSQQTEDGVPVHTLHTVTPADTLQGLSLRYGASAPAHDPQHSDQGRPDGGEGRRDGVVRAHDLLQQCQDSMDRTLLYLSSRPDTTDLLSPAGSSGGSRDGRALAQLKAERQRTSTSSLQGEHSETVRRVSREFRLSQDTSLNDDLNSSVPDDIFTL